MRGIYFSLFHRRRCRPVRKLKLDKDYLRKNALLYFLAAVLLCGMVTGCLSARTAGEDLLGRLQALFFGNVTSRSVQPMWVTFTASLTSSFLFLLTCVMMGLSAWGIALIPAVSFFRGFGLGVSSGYLYATFGLKGVGFNLAVMMPGMLLSSVSLLLACKEAMRFSLKFTSSSLSSKGETPDLRLYLTRSGLCLLIGVAAAFCDMVFTSCFAGLFSF